SCSWAGTVGDAQESPTFETSALASQIRSAAAVQVDSKADLQQIKRLLDTRHCPAPWRRCIEALVSEVQRTRSLLELVERAEAHEAKQKSANSRSRNDTAKM